jgi:hypothetical protein
MIGLKDPFFPVMPTHQIAFTWAKEAEYFSGHPCYSEELGVDITTANAFWGKMCAEYPKRSSE